MNYLLWHYTHAHNEMQEGCYVDSIEYGHTPYYIESTHFGAGGIEYSTYGYHSKWKLGAGEGEPEYATVS
jgi:hypothetical protein